MQRLLLTSIFLGLTALGGCTQHHSGSTPTITLASDTPLVASTLGGTTLFSWKVSNPNNLSLTHMVFTSDRATLVSDSCNGNLPAQGSCTLLIQYSSASPALFHHALKDILTLPLTLNYSNDQASASVNTIIRLYDGTYSTPANVTSLLPTSSVNAFAPRADHALLAGTNEGLALSTDNGKTFKTFTFADGLTGSSAVSAVTFFNGQAFVANAGERPGTQSTVQFGHLFTFNENSATPFSEIDDSLGVSNLLKINSLFSVANHLYVSATDNAGNNYLLVSEDGHTFNRQTYTGTMPIILGGLYANHSVYVYGADGTLYSDENNALTELLHIAEKGQWAFDGANYYVLTFADNKLYVHHGLSPLGDDYSLFDTGTLVPNHLYPGDDSHVYFDALRLDETKLYDDLYRLSDTNKTLIATWQVFDYGTATASVSASHTGALLIDGQNWFYSSNFNTLYSQDNGLTFHNLNFANSEIATAPSLEGIDLAVADSAGKKIYAREFYSNYATFIKESDDLGQSFHPLTFDQNLFNLTNLDFNNQGLYLMGTPVGAHAGHESLYFCNPESLGCQVLATDIGAGGFLSHAVTTEYFMSDSQFFYLDENDNAISLPLPVYNNQETLYPMQFGNVLIKNDHSEAYLVLSDNGGNHILLYSLKIDASGQPIEMDGMPVWTNIDNTSTIPYLILAQNGFFYNDGDSLPAFYDFADGEHHAVTINQAQIAGVVLAYNNGYVLWFDGALHLERFDKNTYALTEIKNYGTNNFLPMSLAFGSSYEHSVFFPSFFTLVRYDFPEN